MSGTNNFTPLPNTTDLATLQAVMQENAEASTEYAGGTITLYPGDLTPGSGGSLSLDGNTYTLPFQTTGTSPDDWTGQVDVNGSLLSVNSDTPMRWPS